MRPVLLEQARLVLAHAARDFLDRFIDGRIHVLALGVGLDGDVIGAKKDDLCRVLVAPVLMRVKNCLGLDDARVIEMKSLDSLSRVIAKRVGHLVMADSHGNGQIHICGLHVIFPFNVTGHRIENRSRIPPSTLSADCKKFQSQIAVSRPRRDFFGHQPPGITRGA